MQIDDVFWLPTAGVVALTMTILFPLSYFALMRYRRRIGKLFNKVERGQSTVLPALMASLAWIALVLAMRSALLSDAHSSMRPESAQPIGNAATVHLIIDNSPSMGVDDGRYRDRRFDDAKEIAERLIMRLPGQFAVYTLASGVLQESPPSYDNFFAESVVRSLMLVDQDTDLYSFADFLKKTGFKRTKQLFLLLSDGEDSAYVARGEYTDGNERMRKLIAQSLSQNDLLIAIGVGSQTGGEVPHTDDHGKPHHSSLQSSLLKSMAEGGRGLYLQSNELLLDAMIDAVVSSVEGVLASQKEPWIEGAVEQQAGSQLFWLLVAALLLLTMLLWQLGALRFNRSMSVSFGCFLVAIGCSKALLADVQESRDLLRGAVAAYELQQYTRADSLSLEALVRARQPVDRLLALYNHGTLLAQTARWVEATQFLEAAERLAAEERESSLPILDYSLAVNYSIIQLQRWKHVVEESSKLFDRAQAFCGLLKGSLALERAMSLACPVERVSSETPSTSVSATNSCPKKLVELQTHYREAIARAVALPWASLPGFSEKNEAETAFSQPMREVVTSHLRWWTALLAMYFTQNRNEIAPEKGLKHTLPAPQAIERLVPLAVEQQHPMKMGEECDLIPWRSFFQQLALAVQRHAAAKESLAAGDQIAAILQEEAALNALLGLSLPREMIVERKLAEATSPLARLQAIHAAESDLIEGAIQQRLSNNHW